MNASSCSLKAGELPDPEYKCGQEMALKQPLFSSRVLLILLPSFRVLVEESNRNNYSSKQLHSTNLVEFDIAHNGILMLDNVSYFKNHIC